MKRTVLLAIATVLVATTGAFAETPRTLESIPVYPGAVLAEKDVEHLTYKVEAWPEEVFLWYQKQLGASTEAAGDWENAAESATAVGACSAVAYETRAIEPAEQADLTRTRVIRDPENRLVGNWDGEWVKGILQSRPKTSEGWLWSGGFRWIYRRSSATALHFDIYVDSPEMYVEGAVAWPVPLIDGVNKKYVKEVRLVLRRTLPAGQWEWKTASLDEASKSKLHEMYANPPTEKDLGVPIHPGAALDFDTLASNPKSIGNLYPYTTEDPEERVVAFYEKATGKKAQKAGPKAVGIPVTGDSAESAQLGVVIQSIALQGSSVTAIWVVKRVPGTAGSKLSNVDAAKLEALRKNPPTEAELGAPLYPGAELDYDQLRAIMLSEDRGKGDRYPYAVHAPYEKVIAFYRDKTGQAPIELGGLANFFLKPSPGQPASEIRALQVQQAGSETTILLFARQQVKMSGLSTGQAPGSRPTTQGDAPVQSAPNQSTPPTPPASARTQPTVKSLLDIAKSAGPEEIQAAIRAGARVDESDPSGFTPLMYAALSNANPKVISLLVSAGAKVDATNSSRMTALMIAAQSTKSAAVVQALIEAHANMKLKDSAGKTAYDYAKGNKALAFTAQLMALGLGRL